VAPIARTYREERECADDVTQSVRAWNRPPIRLENADLTDYDAVFCPGGHGPMEDLAVNADSGRPLTAALKSCEPLGVVCHAPAALLAAVEADGTNSFKGYKVATFTNADPLAVELLIRDALTRAGFGVAVVSPAGGRDVLAPGRQSLRRLCRPDPPAPSIAQLHSDQHSAQASSLR
jgi:putative intracellular protease/amidase